MSIEWPRIKPFVFIAASILVFFISMVFGVPFKQSLSIWVFSSIIMGALLYWRFRLAFTFLGIGILLGSGLLDVSHLIEFAGLDIIIFLIGMMIVIGFLEERRFFEVLLDRMMKHGGRSANTTIFLIMFMAALSAALVGEVTSILFITALVIHLSNKLKISPTPLIILAVFATNIGSSATVVGNPVGIIVALRSGYGFSDFLRWATPISLLCLVVTYYASIYYFKDYVNTMNEHMKTAREEIVAKLMIKNPGAINRKDMIIATLIFIGTFMALIFHRFIEHLLGLGTNVMLIGVPIIASGIIMLMERGKARELVEKRVDWWTLSFFLMFFALTGTLSYTGVTTLIANTVMSFIGPELNMLMLSIGWLAGLMSSFMDNVLAVTLWSSIVTEFSQFGVNIAPLWWVLLFAGTLMGNLTIIGSTANIVAVGLVERQKIGHITLREWIVPGALVSISTFALSLLLIYLQLPLLMS